MLLYPLSCLAFSRKAMEDLVLAKLTTLDQLGPFVKQQLKIYSCLSTLSTKVENVVML